MPATELASYVVLDRATVHRIPPDAGFAHTDSLLLRPFGIGHCPDGQKLWCIDQGGLEVPVPLSSVSGISVHALGTVSIHADGRVGADVAFAYYKTRPEEEVATRYVAAEAIGYGVLNAPGHAGEEPAFYLIGSEDGIRKHYSMARILNGPFGEPRNPTFRAIMNIQTAPGFPDFPDM